MRYKLLFLCLVMFLISFSSGAINDSLVSYWKLDESSGIMIDQTGNNSADPFGNLLYSKVGVINTGIDFSNGYGSMGATNTFLSKPKGNISMALWFKSKSETIEHEFISNYDGGSFESGDFRVAYTPATNKYRVHIGWGIGLGFTYDTNGSYVNVSQDQEWHLLTFNLDRSTTNDQIKIYLDGVYLNATRKSGSDIVSQNIFQTTDNITLGDAVINNNGTLMDQVYFWERMVTQDEFMEYFGLTITDNSPNSNSFLAKQDIPFNFTARSFNGTLQNYTVNVWDSTGTLINSTSGSLSGTENTTTNNFYFTDKGTYTYQYTICNNNPTCVSTDNKTIVLMDWVIVSQNTPSSAFIGDTVDFNLVINVSTDTLLNETYFVYNGTSYNPSVDLLGTNTYNITKTLVIPQQTGNFSYYFNFTLSTGEINQTDTYYLNVSQLFIDDCTVYTHKVLNYTIKDEDTRVTLVNTTWNTTADVFVKISGDFTGEVYSYYATNTSNNPILICIDQNLIAEQNYRLDATVQYTASDYVTEYHYIDNYTITLNTTPQNISLYLLSSLRSQEFLITFKDNNFIPVENAIIELSREYLELGQFLTVEIMKTDNDGRTVGHFVLNEEVYTIYIKKDGVLLATYDNVRAFCSNIDTGDCRINLNQQGSTTNPNDFRTYLGITGTESYNQDTRTYSFSYTTTDNSNKQIDINIKQYDNYLNTTYCTDTIIGSSGTLTCVIPQTYENKTAIAYIEVDGVLWGQSIFSVRGDKSSILDSSRYFLAFLLVITIPLFAFTSGVFTILLFIVGLIVVGSLQLIDFGGFIGTFSAFLWFVIAGVVILFKASRRDQ